MEVNFKDKFEEIYNLESDSIFRFCLVRVSSRDQALDLTQEVFLRLWQTLNSSKEISNYKAFLFTVARRLVIDWYRKKKSFSLEGLLSSKDGDDGYDIPDENTSGDSLIEGVEVRYLLSQINKLKGKDKDIIYLRFVEDLSPSQIGEIIGISPNAASVRINRAIGEFRKIYEGNARGSNKLEESKKEWLIE